MIKSLQMMSIRVRVNHTTKTLNTWTVDSLWYNLPKNCRLLNYIITSCACARGKVIGYIVVVVVVVIVVVDTKIAKSRKIGIEQTTLCHQMVESHEKLSHVCFKSLRTAHKHYKSCIFTGHAYRTHLPKPNACADSTTHALSQNR